MKKKLILASGSPRRRELLHTIGLPYEIIIENVSEETDITDPVEMVKELSRRKCLAVAERIGEAAVVLGADTVVAIDGEILGKPADEEEAYAMLSRLAGRTHEVFTGVSLAERDENGISRETSFTARTAVHIAPMDEEEIRWYIQTNEPMDKAGAYGAQGPFARFVDGFDGEYFNVVGLPVAALYRKLKEWDLF